MVLEKSCPECGDQFETYASLDNTYCSRDCYSTGPTLETIECETCGDKFEAKPADDKKYCSRECYHKSLEGDSHPRWVEREKRDCVECGDEFIALVNSSQKNCSTECGNKQQTKKIKKQNKK